MYWKELLGYGVITRVLPSGDKFIYLVFDWQWGYRWRTSVEDVEVQLHDPVLGSWKSRRKTDILGSDIGEISSDLARDVAVGIVVEIERRLLERS
tara:strand:- start:182 stop:466 length:285 start_codon:yes stop_codon:yes gene_type:complete